MLISFKNPTYVIYLLLIIFGILSIFFQLNFEDFWLDEMNSFYVADPRITIDETIIRHNKTDWHNTKLFNIILKNFLSILGYDSEIARYLPFIFGSLSIAVIGLISYEIKNDKSYLLSTLLACLSIYLIKYSQEVRPYTLLLLLSSLNILFYIKLIKKNNSIIKINLNFLFFVIFSVLNYSANPFALIIFFSQFSTSLVSFLFFRKKHFLFFLSTIFIIFIYIIFNFDYILFQISFKNYMLSSDIINVMDGLYFPRFFGSKIMGYIYLISLIILIFLNRKKIFLENYNYLFLFLIIIYSYLIPLIYGLIKTPVLHDRYIIFILIPIFLLISSLTNDLKSNKIKIFFISFILITTISNQYLEIFDRKNTKPELKKTLNTISNSEIKEIVYYDPTETYSLVFNYIDNLNQNNDYGLKLLEYKNLPENLKTFWVLCYTPVVNFKCSMPNNEDWKLIDVNKYHHTETRLIELK